MPTPSTAAEHISEPPRSLQAAGPAMSDHVLVLQRSAGNRAVTRALARKTFDKDMEEARTALGSDFASRGQFLLSGAIAGALHTEFAKLDTERWSNDAERLEVVGAWNEFTTALYAGRYKQATELRKELATTIKDASSSEKARIEKFVGSEADAGYGVAAGNWSKLWRDKTAKLDHSKMVTTAHLLAWRRWEAQACTATADAAARRWVASGKRAGKRSPGTAIAPPLQLSAGKTFSKKSTSPGMALGDVLTYTDQLSAQVARMKRALDDGWFVHTRVLSGILAEGKEIEEHSLLIMGYDGDVFHYFDPDIGGSNNHSHIGFDRLFFDREANRLSTAYRESFLPAYHDPKVGHYGWQASGTHRYQVARVWTV